MGKKTVFDRVATFDLDKFEGRLINLLSVAQEVLENYGEDAEIKLESYYESGETYYSYGVYVERDETDEEQASREALEQAQLQAVVEKERALLQQLKKKYEGNEA